VFEQFISSLFGRGKWEVGKKGEIMKRLSSTFYFPEDDIALP